MKYINNIVIIITLIFLFSGCGEDDDSVKNSSNQIVNEIVEEEYSNVDKTLDLVDDGESNETSTDNNTTQSTTGSNSSTITESEGVPGSVIRSIPFPTLPTNIGLDNKYIPPQ